VNRRNIPRQHRPGAPDEPRGGGIRPPSNDPRLQTSPDYVWDLIKASAALAPAHEPVRDLRSKKGTLRKMTRAGHDASDGADASLLMHPSSGRSAVTAKKPRRCKGLCGVDRGRRSGAWWRILCPSSTEIRAGAEKSPEFFRISLSQGGRPRGKNRRKSPDFGRTDGLGGKFARLGGSKPPEIPAFSQRPSTSGFFRFSIPFRGAVAVNGCETPRCGFMPLLGAARAAPP
jgi:hypothetical protein